MQGHIRTNLRINHLLKYLEQALLTSELELDGTILLDNLSHPLIPPPLLPIRKGS